MVVVLVFGMVVFVYAGEKQMSNPVFDWEKEGRGSKISVIE